MKNRPPQPPPAARGPTAGTPAQATASATLSPALRRYLYTTAAFTGATIMIIEILGAKMLSPYFGMSHFVWTAQIATTLVALATGYYAGGRFADKSQQVARLYLAILGAAAYMALGVLMCKPVSYWSLGFDLAVGSLLASLILFFIPLALLAMTVPFLVRVVTASVSSVGGNVGRLTAISTIGSFVGTILIGYFLIPFLPNSVTMFLTALALMLICTGYFGVFRRPSFGPLTLILVLALTTGVLMRGSLAARYNNLVELFHGNSHFGQLQVLDRDDGSCRYYLNDFLTQNTYDPKTKQSMSHFTYMLSGLARAYTTNVHDALCIGLGVGIVPMDFARSGVAVDVVEINPAVVPVGVKHFGLDTNKIHLTLDDGRHFLNQCRKKYDAVVLDAFLGDSSPSHLLSREAFGEIQKVLRPGGVLVINAFGELETSREAPTTWFGTVERKMADTIYGHRGPDFFAASINKTLKSVFKSVRIHGNGDGGMFYVATDRTPLEFLHPPDLTAVHPSVYDDTKISFDRTMDTVPEDGIVLRDDYNPAEFYDAANREELRRRLAMSARKM